MPIFDHHPPTPISRKKKKKLAAINACELQVDPALFEYALIEIGLYPKWSQNHSPASNVLICWLNSKFG